MAISIHKKQAMKKYANLDDQCKSTGTKVAKDVNG